MENVVKAMCLLSLVLCGFRGNAQQDWRAGHLVTGDSTIIKGQILFEDWGISPHSIEFKDESGTVTRRSAQEIKGFYIQEPLKTFQSKNLKLTYYAKTVVAEGKSPIARTDSVSLFLEVLLQSSIVTLYECLDDEGNARFFLQKDARLHELRNPVYRLAKGDASHVIKSEVYKAQLKQLLSECPTLDTDNVKYSDVDIIKLLEKYLRYCKADFRTDFQQTALGQSLAFGGMFRHAPNNPGARTFVGLDLLLFSKKKFNSGFVSIEIGAGFARQDEKKTVDEGSRFYFGLYGGKYFGLGDWHPILYTGISNANGALDTGVGISYKRDVSVAVSAGLINLMKSDAAWSFQVRITPFSKK